MLCSVLANQLTSLLFVLYWRSADQSGQATPHCLLNQAAFYKKLVMVDLRRNLEMSVMSSGSEAEDGRLKNKRSPYDLEERHPNIQVCNKLENEFCGRGSVGCGYWGSKLKVDWQVRFGFALVKWIFFFCSFLEGIFVNCSYFVPSIWGGGEVTHIGTVCVCIYIHVVMTGVKILDHQISSLTIWFVSLTFEYRT